MKIPLMAEIADQVYSNKEARQSTFDQSSLIRVK